MNSMEQLREKYGHPCNSACIKIESEKSQASRESRYQEKYIVFMVVENS